MWPKSGRVGPIWAKIPVCHQREEGPVQVRFLSLLCSLPLPAVQSSSLLRCSVKVSLTLFILLPFLCKQESTFNCRSKCWSRQSSSSSRNLLFYFLFSFFDRYFYFILFYFLSLKLGNLSLSFSLLSNLEIGFRIFLILICESFSLSLSLSNFK